MRAHQVKHPIRTMARVLGVSAGGRGPLSWLENHLDAAVLLVAEGLVGCGCVIELQPVSDDERGIDLTSLDPLEHQLMEMTRGRGPDRCVDAVGAEAHASGSFDAVVDAAKAAVMLGTDRPHVLREAIMCCRKGGTVSIPGVYIGLLDKVPFGAAMNKGLTLRMGQTHMPKYMAPRCALPYR